MPYQSSHTQGETTLTLWPFRSLPRRGFAAFILVTFAFIVLPLFAVIGTIVLWALLPFLMLAVAALWWGLERSYRDGRILEVLTLGPETAHLVRTDPRGNTQDWSSNIYWVRAEMHQSGGPVPWYVTLSGNGRTVEIGAFLSEDERRSLYGELATALKTYRP